MSMTRPVKDGDQGRPLYISHPSSSTAVKAHTYVPRLHASLIGSCLRHGKCSREQRSIGVKPPRSASALWSPIRNYWLTIDELKIGTWYLPSMTPYIYIHTYKYTRVHHEIWLSLPRAERILVGSGASISNYLGLDRYKGRVLVEAIRHSLVPATQTHVMECYPAHRLLTATRESSYASPHPIGICPQG